MSVDSILKWLGVFWSAVVIVVTIAFFAGGEWSAWREMKSKVLGDGDGSPFLGRLAKLEKRVDGIKLVAADAGQSPEYGCRIVQKAEADSPIVMYGIRDGTGCEMTNINYYKRLSVLVPE